MILGAHVAAVSISSRKERLESGVPVPSPWQIPTRKGTDFVQLHQRHRHWHNDLSYVNLAGAFLLPVLDPGQCKLLHRAFGNLRDDGGS